MRDHPQRRFSSDAFVDEAPLPPPVLPAMPMTPEPSSSSPLRPASSSPSPSSPPPLPPASSSPPPLSPSPSPPLMTPKSMRLQRQPPSFPSMPLDDGRGDSFDTDGGGDGGDPNLGTRPSAVRHPFAAALGAVRFGINFITRNGNLTHKTPISPPSDVAELEYISALHQCSSMQRLREDGSISAAEIAVYLKSRHGINVDKEVVRTVVLQNGLTADKDLDDETPSSPVPASASGDSGHSASTHHQGNRSPGGRNRRSSKLGVRSGKRGSGSSAGTARHQNHGGHGCGSGCEGGVMDLVELASALVIPNLLRMRFAGRTRKVLNSMRSSRNPGKLLRAGAPRLPAYEEEGDEEEEESADDVDLAKGALARILEDCTGDPHPKVLDEELVKNILKGYGEGALAEDDELVREMVEVAAVGAASSSGGGGGDGGGDGGGGGVAGAKVGVFESRKEKAARKGGRGAGGHSLRLDLSAFVEALTSDVARRYDPSRYERASTNFEDVWIHAPDDGCGEGHHRGPDPEEGVTPSCRASLLVEERLRDKVQETFCSRCTGPPRSRRGKRDADGSSGKAAADGTGVADSAVATLVAGSITADADAAPGTTIDGTIVRGKLLDGQIFDPSFHTPPGGDRRFLVRRLLTGQSFDYTNDTFRTRFHVLLLWVALIAFWFAYLGFGALDGGSYRDDTCGQDTVRQTVLCPLKAGIVNQILMIAEFIVFGTPFVLIGSIGNSIEGRETLLLMLSGTTTFFLYNVIFYTVEFEIKYWISTARDPDELPIMDTFRIVALGVGLAVVCTQVLHLSMQLWKRHLPGRRWLSRYFIFGNVQYESKLKRAGVFKVGKMLHSAHGVHRTILRNREAHKEEEVPSGRPGGASNLLSNFGMALNEYIKLDGQMTYVGGILWTWKRIWNGKLFEEDGVWISGRIAVGTVFQVIVICIAPVAYTIALPEVLERVNDGFEEKDLPRMAQIALSIGIVVAFVTSVIVTVLFIPTVVATTLKFRRGALPSLRSEDFLHRYRFALDQATLVYGGMFWGVLFSSVAMALLWGGFVYLLLWDMTRNVVLGLVGNLLGLAVVLITKIIFMQIIRFTHFAAFYRKKPLSTNIITVVLECYAIGISIWFMVVRSIKILVIGALYLGRIDTPLFAGGVGIFGPLELDNWPTVTRKEILIHEAHRHPYLEIMGYLYMMQLRYRDGFAKRACSAWRLVFVLALMPWLHKYRDMTRPEHFGDDEEESHVSYNQTLLSADADKRRSLLLQSRKNPRLSILSMRILEDVNESDDLDISTIASRDLEDASSDLDQIMQIKAEMKRLQCKLEVLESRVGVGVEMPVLQTSNRVSFAVHASSSSGAESL